MAASMFMNSNSLPIALMQSLVITVGGLKWTPDDNTDAMLGRALTYLVLYSTLGMMVRCVNSNRVSIVLDFNISVGFLGLHGFYLFLLFIFKTGVCSFFSSAVKPVILNSLRTSLFVIPLLTLLTASLELRRAFACLCRYSAYANLSLFASPCGCAI